MISVGCTCWGGGEDPVNAPLIVALKYSKLNSLSTYFKMMQIFFISEKNVLSYLYLRFLSQMTFHIFHVESWANVTHPLTDCNQSENQSEPGSELDYAKQQKTQVNFEM